jgi:hypothetical protein
MYVVRTTEQGRFSDARETPLLRLRGPMRSLSAPQPKPAAPMARKLSVIALDTPARDQPVSRVIGSRNTASENMAPIATGVLLAHVGDGGVGMRRLDPERRDERVLGFDPEQTFEVAPEVIEHAG